MGTKKNNANNANNANNEAKINATIEALKASATSIRAIVSALWDAKEDEALVEIANYVFEGVPNNAARKSYLATGYARFFALIPIVMIDSEGKKTPAKRKVSAKGVYTYEAISFAGMLESVVTNFYGPKTHNEYEAGTYYDKDNNIIDSDEAGMTIQQATSDKKARAEAKKAKDKKATEDAMSLEYVLNLAASKTDNKKILELIRTAISISKQ